MKKYLSVITTRLGWRVYGERFRILAAADAHREIDFYTYTPWEWGRRISWQTRYDDFPPFHVPLFDPFTVTWWQGAPFRRIASRYDGIVVGTQAIAAAMANNSAGVPVYGIIDATRNLYRRELGAKGISDRAVEVEGRTFRSLAHIFPYSRWVERDLVETSGVDPARVTWLPPLAQQLGRPRSPNRIGGRLRALFVGSDFIRKGGEALVAAQRSGLSELIDLTIVTKDIYHQPDVPNTKWLPTTDNDLIVGNLMSEADVLVHPTTRDCSAIVVVEAAVAGVPAVTTTVGGIPDLVDDGVSGLLVPPGDVAALSKAIVQLARDPALLTRLAENAKAKARGVFDSVLVYRRMMEIVDAHS